MSRIGITSFLLLIFMMCARPGSNSAADQMLNLSIIGGGTVLVLPSAPPGPMLTCSAASCGFSYLTGASIMLVPDPGATPALSDWSGDCTPVGGLCLVTMDGTKNITATFGSLSYFKLIGPPDRLFLTLNESYNAIGTGGSGTLLASGLSFEENLLPNRNPGNRTAQNNSNQLGIFSRELKSTGMPRNGGGL